MVLVLSTLVLGSFAGLAAGTPSSATPTTVPSVSAPVKFSPPAQAEAPARSTGGSSTGAGDATNSNAFPSNFHLAPINLPGPHPSAWGKAGIPPGWVVPASPEQKEINPSTGPIGPADPVMEFYSTQNGSGGNVTWDVTLPVDRNATSNQSDLYEAVEFAMTVTAPSAWMDECFLQLQLYPDASWSSAKTDNGNWIGLVIGWQIVAATGAEAPCFYDPLYLNGNPSSEFFNMTQGDRLNVTMSGWPGNRTGELLTVKDLTNGNQSYVIAFNSTGGYPLDPAYSSNDVLDALQWGTGGDYPVLFGILTGRGGINNPSIPSNNSYGGCSPGLPPIGATPCPSYNPGSWINDTLHPWQIGLPTFFNATNRSGPPAQVAFSQAYGGLDEVSALAGSACVGRLGSAYCSYPWFSYSCNLGAFEFGATDFPGVSEDFGKFDQYAQTIQYNAAHLGFYPASTYAVPTCSGPSYTVNVGPATAGGTVQFLNQSYGIETLVSPLGAGAYSAAETAPAGMYFVGWTGDGGVLPVYPKSPTTPVEISGNGALYAYYGGAPWIVAVTFDDSPSGEVAITPGLFYSNDSATQTVPEGGVVDLQPGLYSILAYPPQGFEFSGWSPSILGLIIDAQALPFTWIVVTGAAPSVGVTASYSTSVQFDRIGLLAFDPENSTYGGGTVSLGGFLTTHSKIASGWIAIGTYTLSASPSVGFQFEGWYYTQSAIMMNISADTDITLENGTLNGTRHVGIVVAIFAPNPVNITFLSSTGTGGIVVASFGYMPSGGVLPLRPGLNYTVYAAPGGGQRFVSWSPTDDKTIWNRASGNWSEPLVVNRSGTEVVNFGAGGESSLAFQVVPAGAGSILFNGNNSYSNGGSNSTVVAGEEYGDAAIAALGYIFTNWSASGAVTVGQPETSQNSNLTVSGSGTLIATFSAASFPITLLAVPPQPVSLKIDGTAVVDGSTLLLTPGSHTVSVAAPGETFEAWTSTPGVILADASSNSTTIDVSSPGTLTALIAPFLVYAPTISRAAVDVGIPVGFQATPPGGGTYTPTWNGLPGCSSTPTIDIECTPQSAGSFAISVTFVDAWGEPATSGPVALLVNPPPSINSVTLSLPTIDAGMNTTVTAFETGGTGPYQWVYTGLPGGCVSENESSLVCATLDTGTFNVSVTVFDAFGEPAYGTAKLSVNPIPFVELYLSSDTITLGNSVTITSVASDGTGSLVLSYDGLPSGCNASNATSISCAPTKTGTYYVAVKATDTLGKSALALVTLVVNAAVTSILGLSTTELALGLLVLVAVAVIAFVTLRRRPKKPMIVATPKAAVPPSVSRPATPANVPEWSEDLPPAQEWNEQQ